MEKQDVSQAARKIRSLMQEKKYKDVVKIADGLNLNRINNGLLILDIVEAYEKQGDKKAAKQALLNYYDVHGITGRNMMQKLIELCIETRDISNAVGLCMEFENEWPESSISYLMRYQITASAGGSLDERIYYLERYKEAEFEERWGYELAKLYDKNNQKEKCAQVCHEIICFFGTGKYVEKAVQLKERVTGLTEDEIRIVEAAKRREQEARDRREEEERLAREEMARIAEEEARRTREYEERRRQEEEYRHQEEERKRQEEEFRRKIIEEEQNRLRERAYEQKYTQEYESSADSTAAETEETDEEYAVRRARLAEEEKIRQTEEAARLLKERKEADRVAREQKIADALKTSDRYAEIEKSRRNSIYFDEIFAKQDVTEDRQKSEKSSLESGGIFSSFGRMASNVRKTLQPDEDYLEKADADAEIEYITVGRNTQAYVEDVEERMLSELDMLDDEQIDELNAAQIKEIYELKILHDVRENIKDLIADADKLYHIKRSEEEQGKIREELEKFVNNDPYVSPLEQNSGSEETEIGETETEETEAEEAEAEETETEETRTGETEAEETEAEETRTGETEAEETKTEEKNGESEKRTLEESVSELPEEKSGGEREEELSEAESDGGPEEELPEEESGEESEKELPEEESGEEPEKELREEESEEKPSEEQPDGEPGEELSGERSEEKSGRESEVKTSDEEKAESERKLSEEVSDNESAEKTSWAEKAGTEEAEKQTILDRISDPAANLSVQDFSECIAAYAETKGYKVEDSAYITIAVLADEMQKKETPLSLNNAKIMADDAIARIQKRNPLDKIVDRCSKKHAYLLKDKHFYWKN
ncbi:MAG: hypothetical protein MR966_05330 [Lachnospiraceae bacterium]|nr:hypothetical protein [Lachnospiraceae bacterium]